MDYFICFIFFCFGFSVAVILCIVLANTLKRERNGEFQQVIDSNMRRNEIAEQQTEHLLGIAYELQLIRQSK